MEYEAFQPKLSGVFRARFFDKLQGALSNAHNVEKVDSTAILEYRWATDEAIANPQQRRIYRTAWLLLRDLVRAGWKVRLHDGMIEVGRPEVPTRAQDNADAQRIKNQIRSMMYHPRMDKIRASQDFIMKMEESNPHSSIKELIADGSELADALRAIDGIDDAEARLAALDEVIDPYLQLVDGDERCSFTGLRLADIWRYFRYTWSSPAEPTPGREMLYLVRDRARRNHPIIGIAALQNAPIRITDRDVYIGWDYEAFVSRLQEVKTVQDVHSCYSMLLRYVDSAISEIRTDDLCTEEELANPTPELQQKLRATMRESENERKRALRAWRIQQDENEDEKDAEFGEQEKSELGNISFAAEEALYRRKRSSQLHELLKARLLIEGILGEDDMQACISFASSSEGRTSIRTALAVQKSRHIGTSMLELNVCGAIPPYNELLGGKLVTLLMLSPQVVRDYKSRYGKRRSAIASRMQGRPVIRPADLVYVGTSSLYCVGSSQYNRVKIPGEVFGGDSESIELRQIGHTTGYGTLHISRLTSQCLAEVSSEDGYSSVNHVFGEGASPKLRLLRQGLDKTFDSVTRAGDHLTRHAMPRLVYGAFLASNAREYLLGQSSRLQYPWSDTSSAEEGTNRIIQYWKARWLFNRISNNEVLRRVEGVAADRVLVSPEIDHYEEVSFTPIVDDGVEQIFMSSKNGSAENQVIEVFRMMYRGPSCYADCLDLQQLRSLHIKTRLDEAILESIVAGKSVVLTGNPGDGKTHLFRVLTDRMEGLPRRPVVELDASTITEQQLISDWKSAAESRRPFCVAVNQSVLYGAHRMCPDFEPVAAAWEQSRKGIVYDDREDPALSESGVVVFDLGLRNCLSSELVNGLIEQVTKDANMLGCSDCRPNECDFVRNLRLLANPRVRERLQRILDRVSRRGIHVTVRDLQGFISYILFGDRDCSELLRRSGEVSGCLHSLVFSGQGLLFDSIRETFDPGRVSHPIWDEKLVYGETNAEDWLKEWEELDAISIDDDDLFIARKRAFYFYHRNGDALLDIAIDDESQFERFIQMDNREMLRESLRLINMFFGSECIDDKLHVWHSHRYDMSPRRVLYSHEEMLRNEFKIVIPRLSDSMSMAFDWIPDHVELRLDSNPDAALRIDYSLFGLLLKARRGTPMVVLEDDNTRRLWQFMEKLSTEESDFESTIRILRPFARSRFEVVVDLHDCTYLSTKGVAMRGPEYR